MRIQNNISSLNAWRNLSNTDGNLGKSLERLSSGFRINRAADDAAGLAISEKMRAQIRGMNQAIRNAQDGISLVQTAEGALQEVHSILQRMRELSVQAANGTNSPADRNKIQGEMDALASEVTRITNTTRYNSKELLNGAMDSAGGVKDLTFQIGPLANQTITFSVAGLDAYSLGISRDMREVTDNYNLIDTLTYLNNTDLNAAGDDFAFANGYYTVEIEFDDQAGWTDAGGNAASYRATLTQIKDADGNPLAAPVPVGADVYFNKGQEITFDDGTNNVLSLKTNDELPGVTGPTWTAELQINRAQSTQFANNAKTEDAITIAGLDVTTEESASAAITALDFAINTVASQRAHFGAMQNRLEHTIANLSVVAENLTAAESRIRDVDMAAEMANFTKQQILMQAGTAMLAQANAKNQAVLSLLQ